MAAKRKTKDQKPAPEAEAEAKAAEEAKAAKAAEAKAAEEAKEAEEALPRVADGRAVTTKKGVKVGGDRVTADILSGGQAAFDELVKKGYIKK